MLGCHTGTGTKVFVCGLVEETAMILYTPVVLLRGLLYRSQASDMDGLSEEWLWVSLPWTSRVLCRHLDTAHDG